MTTAAQRDAAIAAITSKNAEQDAKLADHEARLKKLEQPVVTPPIDPPPIPGPDPSTRPWPAPVTSRTVDVPTTIKADGSVDVAGELNALIKAQPDGTVIRFSPSATYRIDKGLLMERRNNLVLTGNARLLGRRCRR